MMSAHPRRRKREKKRSRAKTRKLAFQMPAPST